MSVSALGRTIGAVEIDGAWLDRFNIEAVLAQRVGFEWFGDRLALPTQIDQTDNDIFKAVILNIRFQRVCGILLYNDLGAQRVRSAYGVSADLQHTAAFSATHVAMDRKAAAHDGIARHLIGLPGGNREIIAHVLDCIGEAADGAAHYLNAVAIPENAVFGVLTGHRAAFDGKGDALAAGGAMMRRNRRVSPSHSRRTRKHSHGFQRNVAAVDVDAAVIPLAGAFRVHQRLYHYAIAAFTLNSQSTYAFGHREAVVLAILDRDDPACLIFLPGNGVDRCLNGFKLGAFFGCASIDNHCFRCVSIPRVSLTLRQSGCYNR